MAVDFEIALPEIAYLDISGTPNKFPVRRIYCVGRNYAAHVREMNGGLDSRDPPFFFQKPRDAIVRHPASVSYPPMTNDLHFEVELVVAIGKGGSNILTATALDHVFGYAVGVDLTRRDLQAAAKAKSQPWESAKAFDHSAPIGTLQRRENGQALADAAISLHVNGEAKQSSSTKEMTWSVAEIIAKLSEQNRLEPGDVIMTGTPEGVGATVKGDRLEATVLGLPPLQVKII